MKKNDKKPLWEGVVVDSGPGILTREMLEESFENMKQQEAEYRDKYYQGDIVMSVTHGNTLNCLFKTDTYEDCLYNVMIDGRIIKRS